MMLRRLCSLLATHKKVPIGRQHFQRMNISTYMCFFVVVGVAGRFQMSWGPSDIKWPHAGDFAFFENGAPAGWGLTMSHPRLVHPTQTKVTTSKMAPSEANFEPLRRALGVTSIQLSALPPTHGTHQAVVSSIPRARHGYCSRSGPDVCCI